MCSAMEFLTLISAFCMAFSLLLAPCASDQMIQQKSIEHSNYAAKDVEFVLPSLSRKLKLKNERTVKNYADKDFVPHKKLMEDSSESKLQTKGVNTMHAAAAAKGTWREWMEGPNKSEYYTMDYGWVRRRRPIHNKQIPVAP